MYYYYTDTVCLSSSNPFHLTLLVHFYGSPDWVPVVHAPTCRFDVLDSGTIGGELERRERRIDKQVIDTVTSFLQVKGVNLCCLKGDTSVTANVFRRTSDTPQ